jgi:putative SOS response-associated peptidase YedK
MCGRYTLIKLSDFTDMFPWIRPPDDEPPPRYNIAPTQPVAVVTNDGRNKLDFVHWGLIPSWAKDASIGSRMINARAETLAQKPAFRAALKRRRCLIPASGFYEWKKSGDGKTKQPMYIRLKSERPFAFAGLWEVWRSPDGSELPSCTIITGKPNELIESIHDRMAVILRPDDYQRWLEPGEMPAERAAEFLRPYPAEEMEAVPVGRGVNNPANESADCIKAITDPVEPRELEAPPVAAPDRSISRSRSRKTPSKSNQNQNTLF